MRDARTLGSRGWRPGRAGLFAALVASLLATAARAQVPQPYVTNTAQRSGLVSRFTPVVPMLPHDDDRDTFQGTRWSEPTPSHPNNPFRSGLYGQFWKVRCTRCIYPSFRGAPGQDTITEECGHVRGLNRFVGNVVHPFKPVGSYYQNGAYVPIYDLDPLVTGPGPFPWPYFPFRGPDGG